MCSKVVEGLMTTRDGIDSLPLLCDINLRSTNVADDDVAALARAAPLLSHIHLGACVAVTGLGAVASSLRHLDLTFCEVSDASLATLLSSHAPRLLFASFDHCNGLVHPHVEHGGVQELRFVSCRSMSSLTVDCPQLSSIDLSANHGLSSCTLTPATLSSLHLLIARHLAPLTLHTLTEELAGRGVQIRSHAVTSDSVYQPVAEVGGVRTGRRVASGTVGRRSVTPSSAQQVSPSAASTAGLSSPTPSPMSAVSAASASASASGVGDGEPDHRRRSAPRAIERRREDEPSASPRALPSSPSSSSSRAYHSGSPVKSRYLLFTSSAKAKAHHRHSTTTLVAPSSSPSPSSSLSSLLPPPLTPPLPTRHRLSRSAALVSSTPSSPASAGVSGEVPPSPHSLTTSFADVSGSIFPYPPHPLKRSISAASQPIPIVTPQCSLTFQPSTQPFMHPFPSSLPSPSPLSATGTSLSALLTSRPIPRSALLSTSPLPSSFTSLPSPLSSAAHSPTPPPPALLPSPSRFDTRASSLSSVDQLPRYFLNSIELYIMQSHIVEIEGRLRADDAAKGGMGRGRPAPVLTALEDGALSSAVRYGLKRQLALLKLRLKKEEKLLAGIARRTSDGRGDERPPAPPTSAAARESPV